MVKNDKTPLFHHKFVYLKRFKVNYLVMSWTTWSGFQVAQFATWKFGRALSTAACVQYVFIQKILPQHQLLSEKRQQKL